MKRGGGEKREIEEDERDGPRTFLKVQASRELSIIDHANYYSRTRFVVERRRASTAILNSQRRIRCAKRLVRP